MALAAMLVEDEPFARDDLWEVIKQFPELEIRWCTATAADAFVILAKHSPNVVYLDVQLRNGNAFELMAAIPESTKVVFVTGNDSYAVRAFEVNALDYLLKPVERGRFEESLRRLLGAAPVEASANASLVAGDRVFVKCGKRHDFVPLESVVAVNCLGGNGTELCLSDQRRVEARRTIQQWERALPDDHFVRVRRSTIVNLRYLTSVHTQRAGGIELHLKYLTKPVSVSRRLASRVSAVIERRLPQHQTPTILPAAPCSWLSRAGLGRLSVIRN